MHVHDKVMNMQAKAEFNNDGQNFAVEFSFSLHVHDKVMNMQAKAEFYSEVLTIVVDG
ncbi:hypothetical protein PS028_24165, partial [Shigella sonnei]|nr:hypothetical protein [Shigella sonnei]